jgi:hypothetical protein
VVSYESYYKGLVAPVLKVTMEESLRKGFERQAGDLKKYCEEE